MRIPGILLEEELGRGSSSVVYRARRNGVPCAVKIGRAAGFGARFFRREAAALARVEDDAIPAVLEVGEIGGIPYLAMELADGETLAARLARGPIEEPAAIALGCAMARALDAVHRRGLVHRDVKPRNVVIEPGGRVRLVDFGFATVLHAARDAAGTHGYAAPEQLRVPAVVDGRADLYALGRVIYECVTAARWPEPPLDPDHDVSPPLAAILGGLLAEDPDVRYRTAGALLEDLEHVRRGELPRRAASEVREAEALAFVDRDGEVGVLRGAWSEARGGRGTAFLLTGARGSGKSRLLRELSHSVASSGLVVRIGCAENEPTPLAALRALVAGIAAIGERHASELARAIGPELTPFAAAIAPAMGELLGESASTPQVGAEAFTELAAELLVRCATALGPMAMLIDDAQVLDPVSAEVLARLAHRVRRMPLLVVVAGRTEASVLPLLQREGPLGSFLELELGSFDERAAASLAASYLGKRPEPAVSAWITRLADGTPLALLEVLEATLDSGALAPRDGTWRFDRDVAERMNLPRGALALLERRLGALPEATVRVFEAAAVVGRAFDHDLLARVIGIQPDELGFAVAEARREGLIEAGAGGTHRFVHDCVREALLAGIEPSTRRRHHQRIAEALDAAGDSDPYGIAIHYAAGEPERNLDRMLEVCHAASRRSLDAFDNEAALRFFEMARSAASAAGREVGVALLTDAAEAKLRVGAHEESIALFEAALEGTRGAVPRGTVLGRIAWAQQMKPDPDAAWAVLERAFGEMNEHMPIESPESAARSALGWVGSVFGASFDTSLLGPQLDRAAVELLCDLHYQNARLGIEYGRPLRLLQSTLRARALATRLGPSAALAKSEALYGVVSTFLGRRELGAASLARAASMASEVGHPPVQAYCTQLAALAACFTGDFDEALEHLRLLLDEQGHWLETYELYWNVFNAHLVEVLRGRPREAWAWLERGIGRAARQGRATAGFELIAISGRATFTALHGDDRGVAKALRVACDLRPPAAGFTRIGTWGARARYFVEQGEVGADFDSLIAEFAAEAIEPRRAHPVLIEYYVAVAHGRIHQCLRATTDADRGNALAALTRATADLAAAARYPLARAHLHLAEAVQAWVGGSPRRARARLEKAEALAFDQGCVWARYGVERVRAHMHRLEGRPTASREHARAALHLAEEQGSVHWARWIEEELGVVGRGTRTLHAIAAASHWGGSSSTSRGQLEALVNVLRVSARELDPDEQALVLVDELLAVAEADRGLLIFEPEPPRARISTTGRSRGGADWTDASARARALIEQAERSGSVQAGTLDDRGEALPHAFAVPLWLHERPAGAVYLERNRERSPFTIGDVELLVALSYQVPVTLELARGLRDRERLEETLRHAHKMEAVGRVAGGLAHDFNNMLMIMSTVVAALEDRQTMSPDETADIALLREAVARARDLTGRLLTFARRQVRRREVCDANEVLRRLEPMLQYVLSAHTSLQAELAVEPTWVRIDRDLFEQAIINLVTNARDAMPDGGTLWIETARMDLGEAAVKALPGLLAGPHVAVTVRDTGVGMPREVRETAFEPFFTTKERGHGTGLGLPMVHGFVDQSDGAIEVESEPGKGTAIRMFLPTASPPLEVPLYWPQAAPPAQAEPRRSETILLVEDEEHIRSMLHRVLSEHGYNVLVSGRAVEALALASSSEVPIDLLISDVVMPEMSGPELAQAIREHSPETRLLFISGYTDGGVSGELDHVPLLQKPFRTGQLRDIVRDVLSRGAEARPAG